MTSKKKLKNKEILPPTPTSITELFGDVQKLSSEYAFSITDSTVAIPFKITKEMYEAAKNVTKNSASNQEKAKRLFDFLESIIRYGTSKRGIVGYRDSLEVWTTKEGVCGEMSYLYISLARSMGLKAGYVSVDRDYKNQPVYHGCAWVNLNGSYVLADIAYHTFDINHTSYVRITDKEAMEKFESWRKS